MTKGRIYLAVAGLALVAASPAASQSGGSQSVAKDRRAPTALSGAYLAGRMAGSLKDVDAAATYYRRALDADPRSPYLLDRAFLLAVASGDAEDGIRYAKRLVVVDKNHRFARLALAVDAIRRGAFADARQQIQESGKGPLADLTAVLLRAWTLAGENKPTEALATIDALEGPDWYGVFKAYHSGLIAARANRPEEAEKRLKRAYESDHNALRVVEAYARFRARQGDVDGATAVLEEFQSTVAPHPVVVALLSGLSSNRTPDLVVQSAQEGAAEVLYGIGAALGREGGEEVGAIYLSLALHLRPGQPLAVIAFADLFAQAKQNEKAIALYGQVSRDSPVYRGAQIQRCMLLDAVGKTEEAMQQLEILIEANQTDFDAIVALGNILRGKKRFAEAAKVYTRAVEQIETPEKRHWALYYFRGMSFERSQQWPKAEKDLQQALALSPDQPFVLNYLGYSWVDQGKNLEEGLKLIRKAVEIRPEDGYIVDSLGWAFYRMNRYEDAVRELEKAVELKPEDPVINDHLGDAYWRVGRHLEARFQWTHARDLKPEPDDLAEIEEKLKHGLKDEGRNAAEMR